MTGPFARLPQPQLGQKAFALVGGIDLVTPPPLTAPGRAIAMLNYEASENGYRRIDGFERRDGHTNPDDATYYVLNFDQSDTEVSEGDTVTGLTSGATGVALQDGVVSSGSYVGSDAAGYLVLTEVTGTFQDNEELQVSAATVAIADGVAIERGASNDTDDTTFIRDAIETARTAIGTVTGGGVIRGAVVYNGTMYAFRDDDPDTPTECIMYKSSASGWTAVSFGKQIAFTSGGTYQISEGDTITGHTSGATATVQRVNTTSGTWAGGDVVGWLTLSGQTGTFQSETLDVGANIDVATIGGDSATITLAPSGRFEFRRTNFYGSSDKFRLYGVDGVNPAFEFDGTIFAFLHTGMTTDTPDHIAVFKKHLFLSFPGGSLQSSGIGTPDIWSAVTGASELGVGDDITGLVESVGGTLTVFSKNSINVLSGNDVSDFALALFSEDSGAVEWTAQMIVNPIYMDDAGVRDLRASQAFGDFKVGTLTIDIAPLFVSKKLGAVTAVGSVRSRSKTSYRLFFSDGSGISIYLGSKKPQIGAFNLGIAISCIDQGEDADGNEMILFGSSDGYVYQLDAGNSFDGTAMEFYTRFAFCHADSPQLNKRWKRAVIDISAQEAITLQCSAEYDYGDLHQVSSPDHDFTVYGGGGLWDEAIWDEFQFDSPQKGLARVDLDGVSANISLCVAGTTTYDKAHTLQTVRLLYSARGLVK